MIYSRKKKTWSNAKLYHISYYNLMTGSMIIKTQFRKKHTHCIRSFISKTCLSYLSFSTTATHYTEKTCQTFNPFVWSPLERQSLVAVFLPFFWNKTPLELLGKNAGQFPRTISLVFFLGDVRSLHFVFFLVFVGLHAERCSPKICDRRSWYPKSDPVRVGGQESNFDPPRKPRYPTTKKSLKPPPRCRCSAL